MDFSYLARGIYPSQGLLPDPADIYQQKQTLEILGRTNREGAQKEKLNAESYQANQDAYEIVKQAKLAGGTPQAWEAAMRDAMTNGKTRAAQVAFEYYKKEEDEKLKLDKGRAEVGEISARTKKEEQATRKGNTDMVSNFAGGIADGSIPVTPRSYQILVEQMKYADMPFGVMGRLPPQEDTEGVKQFAAQLQSINPKDRADILETRTMLPVKKAKDEATTGKTLLETQQMPAELRVKQQQAGTAAYSAQTSRMQYDRPPMQHVGNPEQGMYTFDPKAAPGAGFAPAVGADGKPMVNPTGKPMTEHQSKAVELGSRMADADNTMKLMQKQGFDPTSGTFLKDMAVDNRMLSNWMGSDEGQQYIAAGKSFTASILRRDSGAAITDTEWELGRQLWVPMPGDSKDKLAQKERNRMVALESIKASLGQHAGAIDKVIEKVGAPLGMGGVPEGKGGGAPTGSPAKSMSNDQLLKALNQ